MSQRTLDRLVIGSFVVLMLLAVLAGCLIDTQAKAQASQNSNLPIVLHTQQPTTTLTTLIDRDCGFVTAVNVPNTARIIVGYIDRTRGNRLFIAEDMGDRLVELDDPTGALAALVRPDVLEPQFVYDGPKQGAAAMVTIGTTLHIYATARDPGDGDGPFKLKRLSMRIPPAPER